MALQNGNVFPFISTLYVYCKILTHVEARNIIAENTADIFVSE